MGSLVIPTREQRRVASRPAMPPIIEDCLASGESSEDEMQQGTSSAASSLVRKHGHQRTSSSGSSTTTGSEDGKGQKMANDLEGRPMSGGDLDSWSRSHDDLPENTKPRSLLDSMHKKYYPGQYHRKNRARSAEALCRRTDSNDSLSGRSRTMPKPKTTGEACQAF